MRIWAVYKSKRRKKTTAKIFLSRNKKSVATFLPSSLDLVGSVNLCLAG